MLGNFNHQCWEVWRRMKMKLKEGALIILNLGIG